MNRYDQIEDYDLRQLVRMEGQIKSYEEGKLYLCELIGDLMFLSNALQVEDDSWCGYYDSMISDLESVNSYIITHNVAPSEDELKIVNSAIQNLKKIIKTHPKYREDWDAL